VGIAAATPQAGEGALGMGPDGGTQSGPEAAAPVFCCALLARPIAAGSQPLAATAAESNEPGPPRVGLLVLAGP